MNKEPVTDSSLSDLMRGRWDKFCLDMLITLITRTGQRVELVFG